MFQTSFNQNNNDRKFALRPRCLVCTMRHCGSDDPCECPCRGDNFRPDWMSTRMRKCNADHGSSPKKDLNFLPLPPIEPVITKTTLQVNEDKDRLEEDYNASKIANTDDDGENCQRCNQIQHAT